MREYYPKRNQMRQLLTPRRLAEQTGKSAKWWREHKNEVGYLAIGKRGIFFDAETVNEYLKRVTVPARW